MESDAVFLYSYQEQQPLSILEAMSCGVPWFAPDAGALSTLEGGIVLKNTSPSVLEKAVESLKKHANYWGVKAAGNGKPVSPPTQ